MKNAHFTKSLTVIAGISIVAGLINFLNGMPLNGMLSGYGTTTVSTYTTPDTTLLGTGTLYPATYAGAEAAAQFSFGILLIVLGFFLHALSKMRSEQPVHITAKPSMKRPKNWYWVQIRV